MVVRLTVDRSHIVLVKGWNARRRGLRRKMGRIGGFGGCRVVVVVVAVGDSTGPWRPRVRIWNTGGIVARSGS